MTTDQLQQMSLSELKFTERDLTFKFHELLGRTDAFAEIVAARPDLYDFVKPMWDKTKMDIKDNLQQRREIWALIDELEQIRRG